MSNDTISAAVSASAVAISAAFDAEDNAVKVTAETIVAEARKHRGMTATTWVSSGMAEALKGAFAKGRKPTAAANRLTASKTLFLVSANRPTGKAAPKPGKWAGDLLPGESLTDAARRLSELRDALQTASGEFVMPRAADGTKAPTRGAKKGTKSKGGRKRTRNAPTVQNAPKDAPKDAAEARARAARQLVSTDAKAARLLLILAEHEDEFDKWAIDTLKRADEADKAQRAKDARDAKAAKDAAREAAAEARKTNLAAPSAREARKPNGATVN